MSYLYHYTTVEALLSILSTHELWATNILFLNDKSEFNDGLKLYKTIVKKNRIKIGDNYDFFIGITDFSQKEFEVPNVHVVSFCSQDNLLSQWRAYSGNNGVSIGFDSEILQYNINKNYYPNASLQARLLDVIYDEKDKIKSINDFLSYTEKVYIGRPNDRWEVQEILFELCASLKHNDFKEENEKRLYINFGNNLHTFLNHPHFNREDSIKVQYRVHNSSIIPYFKLNFYPGEDLEYPINSIKIAPTNNAKDIKKSIEYYLDKSHIKNDIKVTISSTPLR